MELRRLAALLLLLLLNFPLIAVSLRADSGPTLPACCRGAGKHHCAREAGKSSSTGPAFSASNKCPLFPAGSLTAAHAYAGLELCTESAGAFHLTHRSSPAQTQARFRISFSRSRQKRGPPSLLS